MGVEKPPMSFVTCLTSVDYLSFRRWKSWENENQPRTSNDWLFLVGFYSCSFLKNQRLASKISACKRWAVGVMARPPSAVSLKMLGIWRPT